MRGPGKRVQPTRRRFTRSSRTTPREGILLPRTEENIRKQYRHFLVLRRRAQIAGCVSLENYGADLAEIRSLAVSPEIRGRGLGARLVEFALLERAAARKLPACLP